MAPKVKSLWRKNLVTVIISIRFGSILWILFSRFVGSGITETQWKWCLSWGILYYTALLVDKRLSEHTNNKNLENGHILNVWSSGTERVGHATLSLSNGGYISLWPGGDSVRSDNLFKKLPAQGVFETDFKRDIINERGKPDLQFNIPPHLLDSDKVIQWKKSYEGDGVYKLKGMNCANAVEKALNSGGLYLLGGSHHGFAKIRVPLASDESFGVKFKTPLLTLPQGILNRVKLTLAVMESGTFFRTVYILIHMGSSFCLIPGVIYCCKKIGWPVFRYFARIPEPVFYTLPVVVILASFYPENIFSFSRFVRDFVREFFR